MKEKRTMKNARQQSTFERIVQRNIVTIVLAGLSALTAIANLWTVSKLAPVTQDLAVVSTKVQALELSSEQHVSRHEFDFTNNALTDMILEWKNDTDKRLDRIENKLDNLR